MYMYMYVYIYISVCVCVCIYSSSMTCMYEYSHVDFRHLLPAVPFASHQVPRVRLRHRVPQYAGWPPEGAIDRRYNKIYLVKVDFSGIDMDL